MFGAYVYERCLEGGKPEAIYKNAADAWQNASGRDLGTAVSMLLNSLDDKAGYEELQSYKPVPRIGMLKAAQKRTAGTPKKPASRAPRRHREVGEEYEDGDTDTRGREDIGLFDEEVEKYDRLIRKRFEPL